MIQLQDGCHFPIMFEDAERTIKEELLLDYMLTQLGMNGEEVFFESYGYEDLEYGGMRQGVSRHTSREMLADMIGNDDWDRKNGYESLLTCKTLDQFKSHYRDVTESRDVWIGHIETETEYQDRKADEERKRLEGLASEIAQEEGCKVDSIEFIRACERRMERQRDYRYGLREDGLCATSNPFSSAGRDEWNDMYNSSVSREATVGEILEWLAENCPLLWAKYQETRNEMELEEEEV
jgi:hypothetical protein